jgi:hypothetical protein
MTAAFGLGTDEEACVRVLNELVSSEQFAFDALQCLRRWRDGEWKLDAPPPPTAAEEPISIDEAMDLVEMGRSLPTKMPFSNIGGLDELDMRVGCADIYFVSIIGVNDGYVELCANSDPPDDDEILAWLWIVRPELKHGIVRRLGTHPFADGICRLV